MSLFSEYARLETRRQFFARGRNALGYAALASLFDGSQRLWAEDSPAKAVLPHFSPKVKNIIYRTWSAAPRRWTSTTTSP